MIFLYQNRYLEIIQSPAHVVWSVNGGMCVLSGTLCGEEIKIRCRSWFFKVEKKVYIPHKKCFNPYPANTEND